MAQPASQTIPVFRGDSFDLVFRILDVVEAEFLAADFELRLRRLEKDSQGRTELLKRTGDGTLLRSVDGTTGVLRVRLWPQESDRIPVGSIATFRFVKASAERGRRTYVTGRLVGVTDPDASAGDVGVEITVDVGETVIEISVSDIAGVALAGKANTDGSNTSAASFRGAIDAATGDLSNLDTGAKQRVALFNIGDRTVPIESEGASQSTDLTTTEQLANNAAAIRAAAIEAWASGRPLKAERNRVYRCGPLDLSDLDGLHIVGGLTIMPIVPPGSVAKQDIKFAATTFEADVSLVLPSQALSQNLESAIVGGGAEFLGRLSIYPEDGVQRNGQIVLHGHDIRVHQLTSAYINRPLSCLAASIRGAAQTIPEFYPIEAWRGLYIGGYDIYSAIRGMRLHGLDQGYVGKGRAWECPAGTEKRPGRNNILCGGLTDFTIDDAVLSNSPEHGLRLGDSEGYESRRLTIGHITSHRPGGCVVKINDGSLNELGEKKVLYGFELKGITATDVGRVGEPGSIQGHGSSILRIAHLRGAKIGPCVAAANTTAYGALVGLEAVDCDDVYIASLTVGGLCRRLLNIRSDGDWPGPTPDVKKVTIGYVSCRGDGVSPAAMRFNLKPTAGDLDEVAQGATPQGKLGDFRILDGDIYGFGALASIGVETIDETGDYTPVDGDVLLSVRMHGAGVLGGIYGAVPATDRLRLDVTVADGTTTRRYQGRGDQYNLSGDLPMDPGAAVVLKSADGTKTGRLALDSAGKLILPSTAGLVRVPPDGSGGAPVTITGTTTATLAKRVTIPGGWMGPNGYVEIWGYWTTATPNTNQKNGRTKIAGNVWNSGQLSANATGYRSLTIVHNQGSETLQIGGIGGLNVGSSQGTIQTASINTALDWTIDLDVVLAVATDDLTLSGYVVKVCYMP